MFKSKKQRELEKEDEILRKTEKIMRKATGNLLEKGIPPHIMADVLLGLGAELSVMTDGPKAAEEYFREISSRIKYHKPNVETKNSGQLDA